MTGTIGVVREARRRGLIAAVRPLLEQLQAAGLRLAPALVAEICREVGE